MALPDRVAASLDQEKLASPAEENDDRWHEFVALCEQYGCIAERKDEDYIGEMTPVSVMLSDIGFDVTDEAEMDAECLVGGMLAAVYGAIRVVAPPRFGRGIAEILRHEASTFDLIANQVERKVEP